MLILGDALTELRKLEDESVHCCVTSPPYWGLRDYKIKGQLGLEKTPEEYVEKMVAIFREVRRVLRSDGTLWLNMGDSYCASPKGSLSGQDKSGLTSTQTQENSPVGVDKTACGLKPKDLVGVPWMLAFALRSDGWYLRSDIIWHKPNPMPESIKDRPTKAHEYLFLLSKSQRYYYDQEATREPTKSLDPNESSYRPNSAEIADDGRKEYSAKHPMSARSYNPNGRNLRSVWTIATKPYPEAHFATFPPELIMPCILAGCPEGGTVLDPFLGSGTTAATTANLGRAFIGIELNPEYLKLAEKRLGIWKPESVL